MNRWTGSALAGDGHTIRGRILRIVTPPLAAMLVLLTVFSAGEVSGYRAAAETGDRITVILALQSLVQELQNERGVSVALLDGSTEFRDELGTARRQVDSRRASVQALLADGGAVAEGAAEAVAKLDGLGAVRGGTDTGGADPDDTFEFYTTLIDGLAENYRHLEVVKDDELRRGAESLEYLSELKETTAQERVLLSGVFAAGRFRADEYAELLTIVVHRDLQLEEFEEFASPTAAAAKASLFNTEPAARARTAERLALNASHGQKLQVDAAAWRADVATLLDGMARLAQQIGTGAQARADTLRNRATVRISLLSAVVLLCLAGSLFLATAGTRSLAVPLATLAGEANRLARERLPEAVRRAVAGDAAGPPDPVQAAPGATVEVRQVADAFEQVQETAYNLATEQAKLRRVSAESLANLGRRNQNLLRRQLGFITRLEREESDPAGLANLFELDHLATRMRRNAESLLVLVGAASPRQWSGQLPLTDVIRAAVSEVEEYRRVILRRTDEAMVQGSVATGLAHMLAELIENGLAFSPPDVEVEIHGRRLGGGYLIAVSDQGVGMSEDELQRANQRLSGDVDFLIAPARFLGHYVVGRLAAEMGIQVQLTPSPVTGVTARIQLPAGMLADPSPVAAPPERRPAPAGEPHAGEYLVAAPMDVPNHERARVSATVSPPAEAAHATVRPSPAPAQIPAARLRPRALEVDYVVVAEQPPVPAPRPIPESASATAPTFEFGAVTDEFDRTPNGLRKRVPSQHRPRTAVTRPAPRPEPSVPVVDAFTETGTRLAALRDGIQRGDAHRVHHS